MTDRTITLRSDLVDRLETLAQTQGRTVDDVFGELLEQYVPFTASVKPSANRTCSWMGMDLFPTQ